MISVIIPSYNRSQTLPRVLDSFIAQSYVDWECIVVDDYSTDTTYELVQSYVERDSRIHYTLNTCTKGAQGARNTGISQAQGEWIALFDSDDYAFPNYLEELSLKIAPDVDVVTSNANIVDINTGEIIEIANWSAEGKILKDLLIGNKYVGFNSSIIRKSALNNIGYLDSKCVSHQEYDTHIRLAKHCMYAATNKVLSNYYVHGTDTISVDNYKHFDGYSYILLKHSLLWRFRGG